MLTEFNWIYDTFVSLIISLIWISLCYELYYYFNIDVNDFLLLYHFSVKCWKNEYNWNTYGLINITTIIVVGMGFLQGNPSQTESACTQESDQVEPTYCPGAGCQHLSPRGRTHTPPPRAKPIRLPQQQHSPRSSKRIPSCLSMWPLDLCTQWPDSCTPEKLGHQACRWPSADSTVGAQYSISLKSLPSRHVDNHVSTSGLHKLSHISGAPEEPSLPKEKAD